MKLKKQGRKKSNKGTQVSSRRVIFTIGFILVLIGGISIHNYVQKQKEIYAIANNLIRPDSPSLGPADAKVTLVQVLDPECESCRKMAPIVNQILKDYRGKVRLVIRYYPHHYNSEIAIRAIEAAGEQAKYWEMHDLLFDNQPVWGAKKTSQEELIFKYAQEIELDMQKFRIAVNHPKFIAKIERDRSDSKALGVRRTPTFFVNGERLLGAGLESLRTAINKALAK